MMNCKPISGTHSTWTRLSHPCFSTCSTWRRQRGKQAGAGFGQWTRAILPGRLPRLLGNHTARAGWQKLTTGPGILAFVACSAVSPGLAPSEPRIWPSASLLYSFKIYSHEGRTVPVGKCALVTTKNQDSAAAVSVEAAGRGDFKMPFVVPITEDFPSLTFLPPHFLLAFQALKTPA